jgi:autotransporter-associated beta strand protein
MKKRLKLTVMTILAAALPAWANPTIDSATYTLDPGTANQQIVITVSGGDLVVRFDPRVQLGDGAGDVVGAPSPEITGVNVTSGTIFDISGIADPDDQLIRFNTVAIDDSGRGVDGGVLILSQGDPDSNDYVSPEMVATGNLMTLTLDTTGVTSGRFALVFEGATVVTGDSEFYELDNVNPLTTIFGTITIQIGDNPLVVWSGADNANNTNFTNDLNWLHLAAPLAGDTIQFSGSTGTLVNMNQAENTVYHSVTFDTTAQGFVLSGNAIGIEAGQAITNNSSLIGVYDFGEGNENIGQVFLVDIKASGNLTIDAASGDLTFADSNISMPSASTLTINGGVGTTVDILSNIIGTSSTVSVDTDGSVIFAGTNTFTTLNILGGTAEFENGRAMSNSVTSTINLTGGSLVIVEDTDALTDAVNNDDDASVDLVNSETVGNINTSLGTTLNLNNNMLTITGSSNMVLAGQITDNHFVDLVTPANVDPYVDEDGSYHTGTAGGLIINTNSQVTISGATNDYALGTIIGNANTDEVANVAVSWLGSTLVSPTVVLGSNSALGVGDVVFNNGTLTASTGLILANNFMIGATDQGDADGVVFAGSNIEITGDVGLDGVEADGDGQLGMDIDAASRLLTINNTTTFSGTVDGTTDVVKSGTGTMVWSGNNAGTFTGDIDVNAGTFRISGDSSTAGDVTVNNGGIFQVAAGSAVNDAKTVDVNSGGDFQVLSDETIGFLTGESGSTVQLLNNSVLTVGATAEADLANSTYAGVISGNGGLTVNADAEDDNNDTPPGIVVLSNSNTYTGPTTIESGALLLTSSGSILSDVTVKNTGILGGQGTAGGNVTVQNGGEITAVDGTDPLTDSAETLSVSGNLNIEAGGRIYSQIGYIAGSAVYDQILVGGTLTLADGAILDIEELAGSTMQANEQFIIATATSGITELGAAIEEDITGFGFLISVNGDQLVLTSFEQTEATWLAGAGNVSVEANWDNNPDGVQSDVQNLGLVITGLNDGGDYAINFDEGPYINVESLKFANTTDTYTLNGNSLQFSDSASAAITNDTAQTQTINNAIITGGDADLTIDAASGDLLLNGAITDNTQLTFVGENNTTVTGVISGNGGLSKSDTGMLILTGANTYTGDTTLNAGSIVLGNDDALGTGILNIAGGALVTNSAARQLDNNISVTGDFAIEESVAGDLLTLNGAVALNGGTHTVSVNTDSATFNGSITNGTLVKDGAGDLDLGSSLAMDGLTINQGTVNVLTSAAQAGPDDVVSDTDLVLNDAGAGAQSQLIIPNSPGAAMDFYVESLSGDTNSLVQIGANTRFWITGNKTTTFNGVLNADYFELSENHNGQLTLTNAANVADKVHVREGTLVVDGALDNSQMVVFEGGTALFADGVLDAGSSIYVQEDDAQIGASGGDATIESSILFNDSDLTVVEVDQDTNSIGDGNTLTINGNVNLNTEDATITVENTNVLDVTTLTLGGVVSNGSLTKDGDGQLNLLGANDFAGGFTLDAGTVGIGNNAALGTGTFTINGGTIQALGDGDISNAVAVKSDFTIAGGADIDAVISGNMNLAGGGADHTVTVTNPGTTTFSGAITGGDLTKSGEGLLILTAGANDFTNGLTVNQGTLRLNHSNATSDDDDLTVTGTGSLEINDDTTVDQLIGVGTGTIAIGTGNQLAVNSGAVDIVISGDGTIRKNSAGTLTLNGANTYTGATAIMDGILKAGNNTALGTGSINLFGGTLEAGASNLVIGNDILLGSDSTILTNDFDMTLTGVITGNMNLQKTGAGTLHLDNDGSVAGNSNTGTVTVSNGKLLLSGGQALDNGSLLTIDSGATLELQTADSFGDNSEVIGSINAIAADATVLLNNNNLSMVLADSESAEFAGSIQGSGGLILDGFSNATFILSGNNTFTGDLDSNVNVVLRAGNAIADTTGVINDGTLTLLASETIGRLDGDGTYKLNDLTLTFGDDNYVFFDGGITENGTLVYKGTDTFELGDDTGKNTFNGELQVNSGTFEITGSLLNAHTLTVNGGTLQVRNNATNNALGDASTVTVNSGNFLVSEDETIGHLNVGENGTTTLDADLTLADPVIPTSTIDGTISGTGDLNITNESDVTLNGTNNSTGATNVTGLSTSQTANYALAGTSTAGTLNINDFGVVDLTGTAGDVNVNDNGTLTTTDGVVDIATITGNLTVADGGTINVDISNENGTLAQDVYNVGGNATFEDNSIVAINDVSSTAMSVGNVDDVFTFLNYDGTFTGTLANIRLQESISDLAFSLANTGSALTLTAIEVEDIVWDGNAGGAGDGLFSTTANWDDDVNGVTFNTDTPGAYDLDGFGLTFSGATNNGGNVTADNGGIGITDYINIASIQFIDTTESFTLGGINLNFIDNQTTDIINNSANDHTINNDIVTGTATMTVNANTADLTLGGDITNNGGIIVTGSNDTNANGVISGDGSLAKTGSGTLFLTQANSYTGGTTLAAGTINFSDDASFGTGTLALNGGTLFANGDRTIGNATTVGGDVTLDGSNMDFTGNVNLGSNNASRTLTVDAGTNVTISSILSGSNDLVKSGDGSMTLSGANTHTGDITVNDGNLTLDGNSAMDDAALLTVNDDSGSNTGSVTIAADETIGALAGDGDVAIGANTLTLAGSQTATQTGDISGTGNLAYAGSGVQTLDGFNSYTGTTTVTSTATGTLAISGSVAGDVILEDGEGTLLMDTNSINGATSTLYLNGGYFGATDESVNINPDVVINNGFTYVGTNTMFLGDGGSNINLSTDSNSVLIYVNENSDTETGTLWLDGTITQDGDVEYFTKSGAGQLNIRGDNNTLTGQFGLANGTLGIGSSTALGSMNMQISGNSTIQALTDGLSMVNDVELFSDLNFTGNTSEVGVEQLTIGNAASTFDLVLGDGGDNNAYSLNIDESVEVSILSQITSGSIIKTGNGTLNLWGDNDLSYQVPGNTYAGFLAVNEGVVNINDSDAMNTDDIISVGAGTLNLNADLEVAALSGNDTGTGTLNLNSYDLTFGGDNLNRSFYFSITGDQDSQLIKEGTGEYGFYGASTFSGQFQLNGGDIALENDDALGTATLNINNDGSMIRSYTADRTIDNDVVVGNNFTIYGNHSFTFTGDFDLSGGDTNHELTVTMPNSDVTTLSGDLSGGDLTKLGTGTLTLSGTNDFTNGLTVNAGLVNLNGENTLAADDDLTIGASGSVALGSNQTLANLNGDAGGQLFVGENTLTAILTDASTFSGNITDGGSGGGLTKEGAFALTLDGTNTFTGPLTINEGAVILDNGAALGDTTHVILGSSGTLALNDDETIGSLTSTVTNALDTASVELGEFNLTIDDMDADSVFAGIISDTNDNGTVTYASSNTLKFNNANTFGTLDITSGTVDMDDSLIVGQDVFDGDVNINGGTLIGNGGIGGALNLIAGTLSIGRNSTGTINVGGDFNTSSGSNMIFELTGGSHDIVKNDVDGSDVLIVDGNVVLANGTKLTLVLNDDNDLAEEGDFYDIIIAGGTLTAGDLTLIDAALIQTSYEVIDGDTLRVTLDNLLDFGEATTGSVNPQIGQALVLVAAAADNGNADAQALVDALGDLDQDGLNQYVKEVNDGMDVSVLASRNVFQLIQSFSQILSNHLTARRSGMPVFAQQGDTTMLAGLTDDPHALAQVAAGQDEAAPRTVPMQQWAAFGKLYGLFSEQDTTSGRNGYSSDTVGIQLGMDYQVNENLIVGVSLDYTSTDVTFDANYGDMDTDSFRIGPFASYFTDNWYVDASLTVGIHSSESSRNDTLGAHDGDFDATDVTLFVGGGYNFKLDDAWTLTPTASLRYTYYNRDAYSETGVGGITYDEYDINTLYSRLGVRLAYQLNAMDFLMIPEFMLGWEHEYLGEGDSINGTFAGNGVFNVNTGNPDENSFYFGAGLTAIIDEQWTTFIRYEGNVSENGETHGISGGVRFEF